MLLCIMVSDFKLLLKSSTLSYYIKSIDLGIKNKQKWKLVNVYYFYYI